MPHLENLIEAACANARALARICDVLQGADQLDDAPRRYATKQVNFSRERFHHHPPDGAFLTPEEF